MNKTQWMQIGFSVFSGASFGVWQGDVFAGVFMTLISVVLFELALPK